MSMADISKEEVNRFYKDLKQQAESAGYHLNPDESFTKELLESILINKDRMDTGLVPAV